MKRRIITEKLFRCEIKRIYSVILKWRRKRHSYVYECYVTQVIILGRLHSLNSLLYENENVFFTIVSYVYIYKPYEYHEYIRSFNIFCLLSFSFYSQQTLFMKMYLTVHILIVKGIFYDNDDM